MGEGKFVCMLCLCVFVEYVCMPGRGVGGGIYVQVCILHNTYMCVCVHLCLCAFVSVVCVGRGWVHTGIRACLHNAQTDDVNCYLPHTDTARQLTASWQSITITMCANAGDSYDMMDDVSSRGQGAAEAQMAAEEGYSNNLQRQLTRARSQIQAVEKKYQVQLTLQAAMIVLRQLPCTPSFLFKALFWNHCLKL